ncbi:MAG: response regulator transcription factor [Actinobacteria bacterium]|nr:response regulator transcription factor [Actinomycetota bacterium]
MADLPDPSAWAAPDAGTAASGAVSPPGSAAPVRVVLVDDHALVREGTLQLLDQEPYIEVVGQTGSAEEGLVLIERLLPDVALVDINLPGRSGLDLARVTAARCPQVRVLVVSAYDDYAYVTEALEIGVNGYLLKTATAKELLDAVRAVADGVFVLDRAVSGYLSRRWRGGPPAPGALTPREADVLALLAKGLSNKHIATELSLGLRTVEGHVSSILAKLGVSSRTEAVLYAISHHIATGEDHGGSARSR